jgi:hypothetical protein
MDESAHRHRHRRDRLEDSSAASDDAGAPAGEQRDELLARAVIDALVEGMSWEQIGARLGVPRPTRPAAVTDRDWQDAIVDRENARAQRIQPEPPQPGNPPGTAPSDDATTSGR